MSEISTALPKGSGEARPAEADAAPFCSDAEVGDWLALLKPRVMALVVFTGLIGLVVAPGHLHPVLAFTAVLCIAVAAGAAGAINMWYDRDIDAVMRRTRRRPIPDGRIAPGEALGFGVTLGVASVLVMWLATNIASAVVLALSIAFYVFVYTIWLKRRTPQNIVIGGAAGAFPPVIGWAAVTGSVDLVPLTSVRHHLLLDTAAFLVAVAVCLRRLRTGRRADVTGGRGREGDAATNPALHRAPGSGVARAVADRLLRPDLRRAPRCCSVAPSWYTRSVWRETVRTRGGVSLTRDAPAKAAFRFSILYLFLLFSALAVDHLVG